MHNKKIVNTKIKNKFLSCYITGLMILASFIVMMQPVSANGYFPDMITTYISEGSLIEVYDFQDGESVIVNLTMDNITGDPVGPPYTLFTSNNNTGDWINFSVSDDQDKIPGESNTPGDGIYWGFFNISSTNSSQNETMDLDAIVQVSDGDMLYIFENRTKFRE